ncbi:MAG: MmcQ/YjbR family DNA-binding protein [Clostridia bacterium]|nr:MmcQ/YjbR family DNA-binding protein [Clostridia bacterium]
MTRQQLEALLETEYGTAGECLFRRYPSFRVYRHGKGGRWFAVLMEIPREKLGLSGTEPVSVCNVKCDPDLGELLREQRGIYPAYHMNKRHWLSLLICEVEEEQLRFSLAHSHSLTK